MKGGFVTHLMEFSLSLNQINKRLESKYGLSLVQWYLLQTLLDMPAVSPQQLARAIGVTPGTLSQALTRLERKRLLFMRDDPQDARRKMISITRSGKKSMEEAGAEFARAFDGCERMDKEMGQIAGFLRDKVKVRLAPEMAD
jgi:DNA-binding MarR family transcriptional regulator